MSLRIEARGLFALLLTGTVTSSFANGPVIGLALSHGSFNVDSAQVRGNSSIPDGAAIATSTAGSRLQLNSGAQAMLAPGSRARVYASRLVLEQGAGQLNAAGDYRIEAVGLRILPSSDAVARVQFAGRQTVVVAAEKGPVRVQNSSGVLVARIQPGMALSLTPQTSTAAAPTKILGCLVGREGKFTVIDETTDLMFEVQGSGLEKEAGNRVEVSGAAASTPSTVAGASQLLTVVSLKRVAKRGCSSNARRVAAGGAAGAAVGPAAGTAAAATAAGMSTAATVAVVAGVAAAATVGGLAAADVIGADDEPSTSR